MLIVTSILIIGSDVWAFYLLQYEMIGSANKIFGYIWITIEIGLKLVFIIMLAVWAKHNSNIDEDKHKQNIDNSLL